ncbi:putative drug exporter of the RND superfamily [Streptomyces sp. yr375]|uniref:MMPL family transporter n=1 Tax=Streptomyces sp. yr375 TaxID=1761906 RepID=UPI0008D7F6C9|nr:MMPL family transporter [Streptomyces sp. yr375]SER47677.1 putative drug exporter of the RND superfamily [Streptomyces sp. yr375]
MARQEKPLRAGQHQAAEGRLTEHGPSRPDRLAALTLRWRRSVLVATFLITALAAAYGSGAVKHLSNGGYTASTADLRIAQDTLRDDFGVVKPHLLLLLRSGTSVDSPETAAAGTAYTQRVAGLPGVESAVSYWTTGDSSMRAKDARSAVVAVRLTGDDIAVQHTTERIVPELRGSQPPFDVGVTGEAEANVELQDQSDADLVKAELVAAPLILLVLLLVFRTVIAALLPFLIGVIGVALTLAILRLVTEFAPVSIFALNLTTALGLGLAVDYSLLLLMRFREETAKGLAPHAAAVVTIRTAGRTVFFSSLTVALCLSSLLIFPLYFLRSLAYAAIPAVLTAGVAAVVVLPAALLVFGRWLDKGDITPLLRRLGRSKPGGPGQPFWARVAERVSRRPLLFAVPVVVLLIGLGLPFSQAKFGLTDERVLPVGAEAHSTAREIGRDFVSGALNPVHVVLGGAPEDRRAAYFRQISRLDGVEYVDTEAGMFAGGKRVGTADLPAAAYVRGAVTRLLVVPVDSAFSPRSEEIVRQIRASPAPGTVHVAGDSALFADTKTVIADRLPYALGVIVVLMFVLLYLFTGSLLVPAKAIVFNTLSLTATFGAMVYIFQDGHLKWLVGEFTTTGYLDVTVPVLMFCAAFGLSMDYEVFLMSRIREQYTIHGDNTRAVIEGLGRTGPIITAAAVLIGGVLLALASSDISVLKLLGLGMFLAVLVDAVLVRGILVPAFMVVMGHLNWWAPRSLQRVHARFGLTEEDRPRS